MWLILLIAAVALWLWIQSQSQNASAVTTGNFNMTTSNQTGSVPSSVQAMAQAIYQFEGGGKQGATNSWNNNPGNIGGGQATYPNAQSGWNALYSYIQRHVSANPNWTFQNFFAYYLTGDANNLQTTVQGDPVSYASYVANALGASPDQTVSSVVGA